MFHVLPVVFFRPCSFYFTLTFLHRLKLPMVVVGLRQQWIGIASIVVVEGVEVEAPQIVVVVQEGFLAGPNIEV